MAIADFSRAYLSNGGDSKEECPTEAYLIETRLFINGEFVLAKSGKTFALMNPASDELSANVAEAQSEDVDLAVEAASAAFPGWSQMPASERRTVMLKLCDLIDEHADEFSYLEAISMGKPRSNYVDHIIANSILRYYAGKAHDIMGLTSLASPGHLNLTIRQPYGVTAAIIPWNVPLIMLAMKVGPALMAGNTLILKSSEKAPLTSLLFARLAQKAGFPGGVLNILSGFGLPCGDSLARHMKIRKIAFTGSTATGKLVQKAATESNLKCCTLELGGKSPLIVFEDANLEKAAQAAALSIVFNSGQICMASTRIYVHETVQRKFLDLYKKSIAMIRGVTGNPLDPQTTSGPQADWQQFNMIKRYLEVAKSESHEFILGEVPVGDRGCFVEPVIISNPPPNAEILRKEVFGPVICLVTFKTEEEALQQSNDSEYGLYASVYTQDINRAIRIAKKFESGTVGINTTSPYHCEELPIGGVKGSGVGRELGQEGLEAWTETKTVFIDLT